MSLQLWDIQPGESPKAYAAFCLYRDAGSARSLRSLGKQSGDKKPRSVPGYVSDWSERFDWLQRARAYDAHLELQARRQAEDEHMAHLIAYRERARKAAVDTATVATALLLKAGQSLQSLDSKGIEPGIIPAFLRAAASVLEASLNAEAEAIGVRRLQCLLDDLDDEMEAGHGRPL